MNGEYAAKETVSTLSGSLSPLPVLEDMKRRKERLALELADVDRMIELLQQNPAMEEMLTLLGRRGIR